MKEKNRPFLTDTHAHLASSRFDGEIGDVVNRASAAGVDRIVTVSCDLEDSAENLELARRFPAVTPTVGIHPLYVHELPEGDWLATLRTFATSPGVAAIGEIGLDYYHPPGDGGSEEDWRRLQRTVFEAQLDLARELGLPAVIHQRNSSGDVAEVLAGFPEVRAVLHCFSAGPREAEEALAAGHHLSFTGIVTFPKAEEVREAAARVPLDRLMVETDCPFLAPVPFRGKRCEPAHLVHTAEKLAEVHGIPPGDFARRTSETAEDFFAAP